MKEFCKNCKRVLAMFLAVVMLLSAANIGIFAPTHVHAVEPEHTVTLGVLIKENFGDALGEEEVQIITSGYLNADKTYAYQMPGDNDELITVDEKEGTVTAKKYTDPEYGTQWIPVSFDLTDGTAAITGYDNLPLAPNDDVFVGTYELEQTNPGNSFTVEVTYNLNLIMSDEDKAAQQEMLDAAHLLAADIALMKHLDSVSVIGDDPDLANKIVELSGGFITNPNAIYVQTILDLMAMKLTQLDGKSAVELIYELVDGIKVPAIESIDFDNGVVQMGEEIIQLGGKAGKDAATSLYNQVHTEGALKLYSFMRDHNGESYLEWVTVRGDELESALASNYADLDYLSNLNSSAGLKDVSNKITQLHEKYNEDKDRIYAEINEYLEQQELDRTVSSAQDVRDLINELGSADEEVYAAIDEKLKELDEETKQQLEEFGVPDKVENADDLDALKNAMVNAYQKIINTINGELTKMDASTKSELAKKGAPTQVTLADTSSYDAFVNSGDQDIQDLTALSDALDAIRQDALKSADDKLQEMLSSDAEIKTKLLNAGAPNKINTEDDIVLLKNALAVVRADIYAEITTELQNLYNQGGNLAKTMQNNGVPRTVNNINDLQTLQTALANTRDDLERQMIDEMNVELASLRKDPGYQFSVSIGVLPAVPERISTRDDLIKLADRLNEGGDLHFAVGDGLPIKQASVDALDAALNGLEKLDEVVDSVPDVIDAVQTLEDAANSLVDAIDALQTLNDARDAFADAKAAVAQVKPYIGDVLNAQEQIELLNGKYLPMLREVAEGLQDLEDGIALMADKQELMDMLILMMQKLCATLKPLNDAFGSDSWNAPKLLNTAKEIDYVKLEQLAEDAQDKNLAAKEKLHVTTTVVKYKMDMYDVTVSYEAVVIDPTKADSTDTLALNTVTHTVTLTKGATADEILAEIAAKIDEAAILTDWAISADNYDRTATTLPQELTEDIIYTISYAPKLYTVTFGDGFAAGTAPMQVPYGYRMTLPVNEDVTAEYTYTVNDTDNIDQGTVITVTENTAISREEGTLSAKQYLTDLVVNTNPGMDPLVKNILLNQALNRGQTISIRVPGKDQVSVSSAANGTTITAKPFGSRVGDKYWIANTALIDDVLVNMVNGVHTETENAGFDKVIVNYQLALTAADLGITDAQLLAAMNIPYELVTDYSYQKAALDALSTNDPSTGSPVDDIMGLLAQMNNRDYVITDPSELTLKDVLFRIESLNESMSLGLGAEAIAAAGELYTIIPDSGNIELFYTLEQYNEQGMIHYYLNEHSYINQITKLNNILAVLLADQGFCDLLEGKLGTFQTIQNMLNNAASLAESEHRVNQELIDLSSPYLTSLITALGTAAEEAQLTHYTQVPDEMVWTAAVEQPGPSKRTVTMTVELNGAQVTGTMNVGVGHTITYAELTAWAQFLVAQLGLADDIADYYAVTYGFAEEDVAIYQDTDFTASWALKSYEVKVDGELIGVITYADRNITLVPHENPDYQYEYYINDVLYSAGTYTLTLAQFKAATEGNLIITRKTVDLRERALIKLIDSMNGAAVLTKDANGEYAIILRVDPDTVKDDMTNFAIGLFLTEYKYIGLDNKLFFDGSKYHLQAAVDAVLNSGICTDSLLDLIDENGNIAQQLVLKSTTKVLNTVQPDDMDNLGGVVMESVMDFGAASDNTTPAKLYVTLAGTVDRMATARKALLKLKEAGVTFDLNNNRANLNVMLPEQAYGAYLAALSLVGEVDIHNVNDVNAKIAIGYVEDLLAPAIGQDVTIQTYENTFAQLGKEVDLSRFSHYFELFKQAYNTVGISYTDDAAIAAVENVSINAAITKLQSVVDEMELPEGISVDLSKLIYEYDDPASEADDTTSGVDATAALKWENLSTDYAAMFLDVRADGVLNKLGMWTEEQLLAGAEDFAGVSVLVLLDDVQGDLTINTTTLLDLNGKTIHGNITGGKNANLVIIDNAYEQAIPGGATGTVSGNVTLLDGKYASDVSAYMDNGYVQGDDGVVSNKLYSISAERDGDVTVKLNATPGEVRDLISKKGIVELALEMAAGLVLNNYNKASLFIENGKVFNPKISDVIGLFASDNKINAAIDTGLSWVSASDLTDIINMFIDDLTDFAAIENALATGDKLATYTFSTAPWELKIVHIADGDYMSMSVGASDKTEDVSLSIIVDGSVIDEAGKLVGALADTVTVDVEANLEDIVRDENNVINIAGSFKGVIDIDFTEDPSYVIMMAAILADGANATLKAKLEAGIEQFYTENSTGKLEAAFRNITIKQLCDSLGNHSRTDNFTSIVKGLNLSDATKAAILRSVDNDEKGYKYVIDAMGIALRLLDSRNLLGSITEKQVALGAFENKDEVSFYYGFSRKASAEGVRNVFRSYKLGYDLDVSEVAVRVRLFLDHVHNFEQIVDDAFKVPGGDATCTEGTQYYLSCAYCQMAHSQDTFYADDALGHDFTQKNTDKKYLKNEATCTTQAEYYFSCSRCGEKGTETFFHGELKAHTWVNVEHQDYWISDPTCTEGTKYYKSCSVCGEKGTETFTVGTGFGHTPTSTVAPEYLKSEANCSNYAVYYKHCSVCNEKLSETFEDVQGGYGDHVTQWKHDKLQHWEECQYCDYATQKAAHRFGDHVNDYACLDCGYVPQVEIKVDSWAYTETDITTGLIDAGFSNVTLIKDELVSAVKNYLPQGVAFLGRNTYHAEIRLKYTLNGIDWITADKNHFPEDGKLLVEMAVPAGVDTAKYDIYAAHMFAADAFGKFAGDIEYPQVTVDGDKVSFYVTGLSPVLLGWVCNTNHAETEVRDALSAGCTNGYTGDKYCLNCGELLEVGTIIPGTGHNDANGDGFCDNCGEDLNKPCEHTQYVIDPERKYLAAAASCTSPAKYYKICLACGEPSQTETFDYGEPLEHNFINVVHPDYLKNPATCTSPAEYYKSCSVGGEAHATATFFSGSTLEHNFINVVHPDYLKNPATCTSPAEYYKSCSVCGTPSTTATFFSGSALSHNFVEDPNRQYLAEPATCTSPAKYYKICSVGGEPSTTETFTYGDPLNHNYVEVVADRYLKSPATATSPAVYYKSCSICGEKGTETFTYGQPLNPAVIPTLGVPNIPVGGNIYGFLVDSVNNILLVDTVKSGLTVEQFISLLQVAVTNDADNKAAMVVTGSNNNLVCTTSKVTLTSESVTGHKVSATYDIVIMGDTNCNGRIESGDAVKIDRHFRGQIAMVGLEFLAADSNRNSRLESGDAVKVMVKYQNSAKYVTALVK